MESCEQGVAQSREESAGWKVRVTVVEGAFGRKKSQRLRRRESKASGSVRGVPKDVDYSDEISDLNPKYAMYRLGRNRSSSLSTYGGERVAGGESGAAGSGRKAATGRICLPCHAAVCSHTQSCAVL